MVWRYAGLTDAPVEIVSVTESSQEGMPRDNLAVLDALGATDAIESALSDLALAEGWTVTWLPDPLGRLDAIGHAVISIDDG